MLAEIPNEDIVTALEKCASNVLWEADIAQPPVDATFLAEQIGLVVAHNDAVDYRGRLVQMADPRGGAVGQGTIVVGPAERPERMQWAVAHEVGESVAYRVFETLGIRPEAAPEDAREQIANHLASCLLLPREWFAADGRQLGWDLYQLKQRYATASHELIVRRMLEMAPPVVVTLCDQGRVRWRRSNAGSRPQQMLPDELAVWRAAHESGELRDAVPDPAATGLERIQAWPIHEPDWKREIIRSAIAEW